MQFIFARVLNEYSKCLFADTPGSFGTPPGMTSPLEWVGPLVDIPHKIPPKSAPLGGRGHNILVTTGGGVPQDEGFWKQVIPALQRVENVQHITCVPGPGFLPLVTRLCDHFLPLESNISYQIIERYQRIDEVLPGIDLVITRGGHTTLWELAVRDVPAYVIPHDESVNYMNAKYAERFRQLGLAMVGNESDSIADAANRISNTLDRISDRKPSQFYDRAIDSWNTAVQSILDA